MKATIRWALLALLSSAALGCDDTSENPECTPGKASCECTDDGGCDDGLTCEAGVCQAWATTTLTVGDKAARACDVLLEEKGGATIKQVRFDDSVKGTFVREAPRTAVSFVATSDAPIGGGVVIVEMLGGDGSGVTVVKSECAGADGAPISGVSVELK